MLTVSPSLSTELDSFPHAKVTPDLMDSKDSIPTLSGNNDEISYFSTRQEPFASEVIERTTTSFGQWPQVKRRRLDKVQLCQTPLRASSEWHCSEATELWRLGSKGR